MNFNKELEQMRELKKNCLSEFRGIEDAKSAELKRIEEEKEQAILKYNNLTTLKYQELRKHNDQINAYYRLIETYSCFDARNIGNAIASLMRTFEGTNYIYQEALSYKIDAPCQEIEMIETPKIIVAEDSRRNVYCNELSSMIKKGKAIILSRSGINTKIRFYYVNPGENFLGQCVNFSRFPYVKDFIDELISYRINHKLESISADDMETLKISFIVSRTAQIEENYKLVAQQQEEEMKQKLNADKENRQALLKRILEKKKAD